MVLTFISISDKLELSFLENQNIRLRSYIQQKCSDLKDYVLTIKQKSVHRFFVATRGLVFHKDFVCNNSFSPGKVTCLI